MKILTQNLKTGKTEILNVPSPQINTNKLRVKNKYSLISTGTESSIVNFGKDNWINKAKKQPDKVNDVINKIKSSGLVDTFKAVKNKLDFPMVMGYSAVGMITHTNENYTFKKGERVFTNSCHQEEALIDYNMCIKIPDNVDSKSACFGSIGGIAMQSIKCIPKESRFIVLVGLGLLGQVTSRILNSIGYKCLVYDLDSEKIKLAEKYGSIGIYDNITESVLRHTNGNGADCTIIAAASPSSIIINEATAYTKRKGKIISSGVVGLNLIRDKFFKKQIEIVVSNSSGDKNHKGEGSSFENINYFFELLSLQKIEVIDLISEEVSINNSDQIYSFPKDKVYFSKLINYDSDNFQLTQTFVSSSKSLSQDKLRVGLIGVGNFAMGTFIPSIINSKEGVLTSLFSREGLSLFITKKKFNINKITTNELDFYKDIDVVCITTPHQTHYKLIKQAIRLSLPVWIEKPLVISIDELIDIRKLMLKKQLNYVIGYNRSFAPWTVLMKNKINSSKTNISMNINAGQLPSEHWLLDEGACGGRILGECCHFIDLALNLLDHTKLVLVECIKRDKNYQDTGSYILTFEDQSRVNIKYRYDLPASVPKENIEVELTNSKYTNNNWKSFSTERFFNFSSSKKGKGHDEAINNFLNRIKNNKHSTAKEIDAMCFSTYVSIKLQQMSKGDTLDIFESYRKEILSKSSKLNDQ